MARGAMKTTVKVRRNWEKLIHPLFGWYSPGVPLGGKEKQFNSCEIESREHSTRLHFTRALICVTNYVLFGALRSRYAHREEMVVSVWRCLHKCVFDVLVMKVHLFSCRRNLLLFALHGI